MTRDSIRGHLVLRLVILVGPVLALLAGAPAGHTAQPLPLGIVVLLSAWSALSTESHVLTLASLIVLGWWAVAFDRDVPVWTVGAAAALLAAHVAALLVGYGPVREPMPREVVLLWARRGVLLLTSAPLLALVAHGLGDQPISADVWVLGLLVFGGAVVAASQLMATDTDRLG